MDRSEIIKAVVFSIAVLGFFILALSIQDNVEYADFDCPMCGGCEVIDYGEDYGGLHDYECADCGCKMRD